MLRAVYAAIALAAVSILLANVFLHAQAPSLSVVRVVVRLR
jgi:hypothetical protein